MFAHYLHFVFEDNGYRLPSVNNPVFTQMLQEKLERYHLSIPEEIDDPYDFIAKNLWKSLQPIFPPEIVSSLNKSLSVTALDSISVNAMCAKSEEGFIAILINNGLMSFLNDISKILVLTKNPRWLEYCDIHSETEITADTLNHWFLKICNQYRETGMLAGPQIHLSNKEADTLHSEQLHIWEMYIFCHELGHVILNHLDEKSHLSANPSFGMVATLQENSDHQMETEADIAGFMLLRDYYYKVLKKNEADEDDRHLFELLIVMFNILTFINAPEVRSHPHPLQRLCTIALHVYGESFSQALYDSYQNPAIINELFEKPLNIKQGVIHAK